MIPLRNHKARHYFPLENHKARYDSPESDLALFFLADLTCSATKGRIICAHEEGYIKRLHFLENLEVICRRGGAVLHKFSSDLPPTPTLEKKLLSYFRWGLIPYITSVLWTVTRLYVPMLQVWYVGLRTSIAWPVYQVENVTSCMYNYLQNFHHSSVSLDNLLVQFLSDISPWYHKYIITALDNATLDLCVSCIFTNYMNFRAWKDVLVIQLLY